MVNVLLTAFFFNQIDRRGVLVGIAARERVAVRADDVDISALDVLDKLALLRKALERANVRLDYDILVNKVLDKALVVHKMMIALDMSEDRLEPVAFQAVEILHGVLGKM